jgi:hypothetical protein
MYPQIVSICQLVRPATGFGMWCSEIMEFWRMCGITKWGVLGQEEDQRKDEETIWQRIWRAKSTCWNRQLDVCKTGMFREYCWDDLVRWALVTQPHLMGFKGWWWWLYYFLNQVVLLYFFYYSIIQYKSENYLH